jgi:hypothetical protein
MQAPMPKDPTRNIDQLPCVDYGEPCSFYDYLVIFFLSPGQSVLVFLNYEHITDENEH